MSRVSTMLHLSVVLYIINHYIHHNYTILHHCKLHHHVLIREILRNSDIGGSNRGGGWATYRSKKWSTGKHRWSHWCQFKARKGCLSSGSTCWKFQKPSSQLMLPGWVHKSCSSKATALSGYQIISSVFTGLKGNSAQKSDLVEWTTVEIISLIT